MTWCTKDMSLYVRLDPAWDYIVKITGNKSQPAPEARKIYKKIENAHSVKNRTEDHECSSCLETNRSDGSRIGRDPDKTLVLRAMMRQLSAPRKMPVEDLGNRLHRDISELSLDCDYTTGVFVLATHSRRFSPANYVPKALAQDHDRPRFAEFQPEPHRDRLGPSIVRRTPGCDGWLSIAPWDQAPTRYTPNRNTTARFHVH
ncbi:hypothetical protein F5B18DRAFT_625968 [Nemania serpens]|nr:hypothetical protein F5B18DRAFT_625968 [Nemania serpens]